jgi:hypothetical protein
LHRPGIDEQQLLSACTSPRPAAAPHLSERASKRRRDEFAAARAAVEATPLPKPPAKQPGWGRGLLDVLHADAGRHDLIEAAAAEARRHRRERYAAEERLDVARNAEFAENIIGIRAFVDAAPFARHEEDVQAELAAINVKLAHPLADDTDWSVALAAAEKHIEGRIGAELAAEPTRELDRILNSWIFGLHMVSQPVVAEAEQVTAEVVEELGDARAKWIVDAAVWERTQLDQLDSAAIELRAAANKLRSVTL